MCYDQEKTQAPPGCDDFNLKQERDTLRESRFADAGTLGIAPQRPKSESEVLAELFSYHPPNPHTLPKFTAINQAAKNFAEIVLQNCPPGQDRANAIGTIRMARMLANAAISLNGLNLY